MKYYLIIILFFFVSCKSSAELSFNSLKNAFINWYNKFHPVVSTIHGNYNYSDSFRLINNNQNEEYIADLNRFLIELSQIDVTKLDKNDQIDYNLLYSKLKAINYEMNDLRPFEWNPLWSLEKIYQGLFIMSEHPSMSMDLKIESLKGRLNLLPATLESYQEKLIYYSHIHYQEGLVVIRKIIALLDNLPLKLNADNITLDYIDELITISKKSLQKYKKWLNEANNDLYFLDFPRKLKLIDYGYDIFIGKKYLSNNIYKMANKKKKAVQNKLFEYSIPIYLLENDEPIWLDRDDTLDVIHWAIDHLYNKPENQILFSNILNYFYESILSIKKFVHLNHILPNDYDQKIALSFSPNYYFENNLVGLFNQYSNNENSELIYFIKNSNDSNELFPIIYQQIDILNAKNLIPGRNTQLIYAKNNFNKLRILFSDKINQLGWGLYSSSLLIEKGFGKEDITYNILKLKEELMVICQTLMEYEYYLGRINRKEAQDFIRKEAFLTNDETEKLILSSDLQYFIGTQTFIGFMELQSLYKEYIKRYANKGSLLQFNKIILENSMIPFNQLKKILLFD